jgi:transposase
MATRMATQKTSESTIVSAVRGGMSKARATHTFDVSLTSVGRYVDKARQGEFLAPKKKSPGSTPKLDQRANKLSKEDIGERPYVTLQERHDCMEAVRGIRVSRSTLCRAIARIVPTSKKGGESPPSATSSPRQPVPERGGRARALGDPPGWRIRTPNPYQLLEDHPVVCGEQWRPEGLSPPFRAAGLRIAPRRALLCGGSAGTGTRSFSLGKHRQPPE